jgi:hypothetical protein
LGDRYDTQAITKRGGSVSEHEQEHLPSGKSQIDIAIDVFIDQVRDVDPNIDEESLHNDIRRCVEEAVSGAESEEGDEEDS